MRTTGRRGWILRSRRRRRPVTRRPWTGAVGTDAVFGRAGTIFDARTFGGGSLWTGFFGRDGVPPDPQGGGRGLLTGLRARTTFAGAQHARPNLHRDPPES